MPARELKSDIENEMAAIHGEREGHVPGHRRVEPKLPMAEARCAELQELYERAAEVQQVAFRKAHIGSGSVTRIDPGELYRPSEEVSRAAEDATAAR